MPKNGKYFSMPSGRNHLPYPWVSAAAGTNYCHIGLDVDQHRSRIVIFIAPGSIGKGRAHVAVQNLNLLLDCLSRWGLNGMGCIFTDAYRLSPLLRKPKPLPGWPFTQTAYLPTISRYVQMGQLTIAVIQRPKIKSGRGRNVLRPYTGGRTQEAVYRRGDRSVVGV